MVTTRHETSHRIFQERPEILTPVFQVLGLPIPEKAAVDVLTPDVTEIRPLERRVDRKRPTGSPPGTTTTFWTSVWVTPRPERNGES